MQASGTLPGGKSKQVHLLLCPTPTPQPLSSSVPGKVRAVHKFLSFGPNPHGACHGRRNKIVQMFLNQDRMTDALWSREKKGGKPPDLPEVGLQRQDGTTGADQDINKAH